MRDSVMFLSVLRLILSWYIPRWYLTSPEPYRYRKRVVREAALFQGQRSPHLIGSLKLGVELTEDLIQVFPDHVSQDVQSTPEDEVYKESVRSRRR